jgi:hypothetical protein
MNTDVKLIISNTVYAMVFGRFADMCNDANRGPRFEWKDFPEIMEDRCSVELPMYMNVPENEEGAWMQAYAGELALELSTRMVKRSGFV